MRQEAGDGSVIVSTHSGSIEIQGGIHITNLLEEFERIDEASKLRIQKRFKELVRQHPEKARFHLALGLTYLELNLHDQAIKALEEALERSPADPEVLYFLAVSKVRGRNLGSLRTPEARQIEGLLNAAMVEEPDRGIYPYFLALLKQNFFQSHGMRESKPTSIELTRRFLHNQPPQTEVQFLHRHINF